MLLAFTGSSKPIAVALDVQYDVYASAVSPADASATFTVFADGTISGGTGRWCNKTPPSSAYECRMTNVSGTLTSGTEGSWLALSSNRSWNVTRIINFAGITSYQGTLEIRDAVSLVVQDSATVIIDAEVL